MITTPNTLTLFFFPELNAHRREEELLLEWTKKKSNPILSSFSASLLRREIEKQEETVPLSSLSLYMSSELDTCSLRDVIVIVEMGERKTSAWKETSARSSVCRREWLKGGGRHALCCSNRSAFSCLFLFWRTEREAKWRTRRDNRTVFEHFILIGLFTLASTPRCGFRRNRSQNFIWFNDDNDPRDIIAKRIHRELLPSCMCMFF